MSKETVSKEYIERNGQTLKVEIYYDLGGYNYFSGNMKERGYYASVCPVERSTSNDGYVIEKYTAFTGTCQLLYTVKRKSKVAAIRAENIFTDEMRENLINHVLINNGLIA